MKTVKLHFSENHVEEVAQQIRKSSTLYDKLFSALGSQIFVDIVELKNSSDVMTVCRNHTDNALEFFQRHFPHIVQIECQKGCSYCCCLPVTCPPQVVADVALYIKERFTENELKNSIKEMRRYITEKENNLIRIRCPFLTEDNQCCIYDRRPLACRSFTSSDCRECHASLSDNRNITQDPVKHRIFQVATTALMAAAKQSELPCYQQDFIPALLETLDSD